MAKPTRSPERAAKVLDRAARMSKFKPGIVDRGFFDTKIRTPGATKTPWHNHDIDPKSIKALGARDVPLSQIRTEQTTVSLKGVKSKLAGGAKSSSALPQVIQRNGTYFVLDGNHRITAARALGQTTIKAHVGELMRQTGGAKPAAVAPIQRAPMTPMGGLGVAAAVAAPAVAAVRAYNQTRNAGGDALDGVASGIKAGGITAAIGATVAGTMRAAGAVLPRVAPALGPVGWAAAGGMAAYGAYRGYSETGTLTGAARGAIGLGNSSAGDRPTMSKGDAARFEKSNEAFGASAVRDLAASAGKTSGGPKGWSNPSTQFAAQAARGVQNFSDWAEQGGKQQ